MVEPKREFIGCMTLGVCYTISMGASMLFGWVSFTPNTISPSMAGCVASIAGGVAALFGVLGFMSTKDRIMKCLLIIPISLALGNAALQAQRWI